MEGLRRLLGRGRPRGPTFKTVFEQLNAEYEEDIESRKEHFASSYWFNAVIVVLIVLNAVLCAVEADRYRGDKLEDRMIFFVADVALFLAFFVEMLARMNQLGWDYFVDPWNVFDYIIVVLNCSDLVVSVNGQGGAGLKLASTLRCLRLLRVVRVIRGMKTFHGLWIIIQGILDSLRTVIWVGILLLIFTYCIAVAVTTLLLDDAYAREQWRYCDQYVGTPWRSMWTVFQVITLDRWAVDIVRPLGHVSPPAMVLLILTIIICTFGITNLLVAVMVERVQSIIKESTQVSSKARADLERDILKSMGEDFQLAELNASGELGFEEFQRVLATPNVCFKLQLLGVHDDEAEALFELMDADKSGSVSPEEFVLGLQKIGGDARGQDLVALICCAQKQCSRAALYVDRIRQLNAKADMIQERLHGIGHGMTSELVGRKRASHRNEEVWRRAGERQDVIGTLDRNRQIEFPARKEGSAAKYGILY